MIFKQYRYEPLSQASYMVGCIRSKKGVVVDPIADLGAQHYILEAADLGLTITAVLETHVHADYVSCARELAEEAGVPHHLHEAAQGVVRYPFTPLKDGEVMALGKVRVETMHTPGHTPEHACYVVYDLARSDDPWLVLTGDCLFVGDVGRPDLLLDDENLNVMSEEERAESQYHSIRERLFKLPDHVEVWPGHFGGSTCGGVNMSGKPVSTIYYEKHYNLAVAQPDAAHFATFVKETMKPFPDNYRKIKAYNLGLIDRAEVDDSATGGLNPDEVVAATERGALVLDVRPPLTFAQAHLPDSVNLQFNTADLADRAEMALPEGIPLIVVAASDAVAGASEKILGDAGFKVEGYLTGGLDAWKSAGRDISSIPVLDVKGLRDRFEEFQVIDARERFEFKYAHIPGAILLPSLEAWEGAEELDRTRPFAVVCGDQVRSATVASMLRRAGADAYLVSGGMVDWLERDFPVEKAS